MGDSQIFWNWFKSARQPLPGEWPKEGVWTQLAAAHGDELAAIVAELETAEKPEKAAPFSSSSLLGLYKVLAGDMAEKDPDKALVWARSQGEGVRNAAQIGPAGGLAEALTG